MDPSLIAELADIHDTLVSIYHSVAFLAGIGLAGIFAATWKG